MRIQHNIMAMNAYRNYNNNTSALSSNLEKLSSGYKINRAGDDAAGLAISEKMRAQISGLDQAESNVKDGISLVKTGEGALQEVQDMLNRMVTLATQSANGTYDSETDRAQLQKEVDSLTAEIDRIADSSNFNGIQLLDGSLDTAVKYTGVTDAVEAGALTPTQDGQMGNASQAGVYSVSFADYDGKLSAKGPVSVTLFGKTITVNKNAAAGDTYSAEDLAKDIATAWNGAKTSGITAFAGTGTNTDDYGIGNFTAEANGSTVTFTMDNAPTKKWDVANTTTMTLMANAANGTGNQSYDVGVTQVKEPVDSSSSRMYAQATVDLSKANISDGSTLTIGDSTYVFAVGKDSAYKDNDNVVDLTDMTADDIATNIAMVANRVTTAAQDNKNFSVTAQGAQKSGNGLLYLTELEGGVDTDDYKLEGTDNGTNAADGDWTGLVKFGKVDNSSMGKALSLQIGDTSKSYNQLSVTIEDMHAKALGIDKIDISTQEGASAAIDVIKNAINQVSSTRGTLGATQNRLEHTQNNLSVMAENIQDAESTIRDTDIAEEMMSYTKNNILVQSAQAMLAQANSVPQGVLQLLQ
jgi:flagellin